MPNILAIIDIPKSKSLDRVHDFAFLPELAIIIEEKGYDNVEVISVKDLQTHLKYTKNNYEIMTLIGHAIPGLLQNSNTSAKKLQRKLTDSLKQYHHNHPAIALKFFHVLTCYAIEENTGQQLSLIKAVFNAFKANGIKNIIITGRQFETVGTGQAFISRSRISELNNCFGEYSDLAINYIEIFQKAFVKNLSTLPLGASKETAIRLWLDSEAIDKILDKFSRNLATWFLKEKTVKNWLEDKKFSKRLDEFIDGFEKPIWYWLGNQDSNDTIDIMAEAYVDYCLYTYAEGPSANISLEHIKQQFKDEILHYASYEPNIKKISRHLDRATDKIYDSIAKLLNIQEEFNLLEDKFDDKLTYHEINTSYDYPEIKLTTTLESVNVKRLTELQAFSVFSSALNALLGYIHYAAIALESNHTSIQDLAKKLLNISIPKLWSATKASKFNKKELQIWIEITKKLHEKDFFKNNTHPIINNVYFASLNQYISLIDNNAKKPKKLFDIDFLNAFFSNINYTMLDKSLLNNLIVLLDLLDDIDGIGEPLEFLDALETSHFPEYLKHHIKQIKNQCCKEMIDNLKQAEVLEMFKIFNKFMDSDSKSIHKTINQILTYHLPDITILSNQTASKTLPSGQDLVFQHKRAIPLLKHPSISSKAKQALSHFFITMLGAYDKQELFNKDIDWNDLKSSLIHLKQLTNNDKDRVKLQSLIYQGEAYKKPSISTSITVMQIKAYKDHIEVHQNLDNHTALLTYAMRALDKNDLLIKEEANDLIAAIINSIACLDAFNSQRNISSQERFIKTICSLQTYIAPCSFADRHKTLMPKTIDALPVFIKNLMEQIEKSPTLSHEYKIRLTTPLNSFLEKLGMKGFSYSRSSTYTFEFNPSCKNLDSAFSYSRSSTCKLELNPNDKSLSSEEDKLDESNSNDKNLDSKEDEPDEPIPDDGDLNPPDNSSNKGGYKKDK